MSYQAVYKAIGELEREGVVKRCGRHYSLNLEWLERLEELCTTARLNELSHEGAESLGSVESIPLVFTSRLEAQRSLFGILQLFGSEEVTVMRWLHICPALSLSIEGLEGLRKLSEGGGCYLTCRGESSLDRQLASSLEGVGVRVKLGVEDVKEEVIVRNEWLVWLFSHERVRKAQEEAHGSATLKLRKLLEQRSRVCLLLQRDPELAERMRSETLRLFNSDPHHQRLTLLQSLN